MRDVWKDGDIVGEGSRVNDHGIRPRARLHGRWTCRAYNGDLVQVRGRVELQTGESAVVDRCGLGNGKVSGGRDRSISDFIPEQRTGVVLVFQDQGVGAASINSHGSLTCRHCMWQLVEVMSGRAECDGVAVLPGI